MALDSLDSNPSVRRIVIAGYPHHVVVRGNNRRRLFSYNHECHLFVKLIGDALSKYGCHLHALALMSNHVHLLLTPATEKKLSQCVKMFCHRYSLIRNKQRGGSGKLFEERFKSFPVGTDEHVAIVTAYIDLNAAQAGFSPNSRWQRWSTYGLHAPEASRSFISKKLWTPSQWYLALGDSDHHRAQVYQEFAQAYLMQKLETLHLNSLEQLLTKRHKTSNRKRFERPNRVYAL